MVCRSPAREREFSAMGRSSAPVVIHRLSPAEKRVLACFLSGRLPAGQIHEELARAREPQPDERAGVQAQPVPAVAA